MYAVFIGRAATLQGLSIGVEHVAYLRLAHAQAKETLRGCQLKYERANTFVLYEK